MHVNLILEQTRYFRDESVRCHVELQRRHRHLSLFDGLQVIALAVPAVGKGDLDPVVGDVPLIDPPHGFEGAGGPQPLARCADTLDLLGSADALARIPMRGKISSLNVSVAAGVAIYEVVRQQLQKK